MKKVFALFTVLCLISSFAFAQTTASKPDVVKAVIEKVVEGPVMTFTSTEIDYGTIEQGSDPLRVFEFKNTGTEPLVIKNARGSCGCTVPSWPKEPILPGETSKIEVRYDTKRIGKFTKTVTLTTNETGQKKILRIKGQVLRKEAEPEAVPTNKSNPFKTNG